MNKKYILNFLTGIAGFCIVNLLFSGCTGTPQISESNIGISIDSLKSGFQEPPSSVKPYTWWHWINGNITREGITKDLEWMKSYGIGGAIVFNVGMLDDSVPRKVTFGSDEWWQMVDHAIAEADRLGLKIGFHNCDGWSHSGGPWMDLENSMKKMVWTETFVWAGDNYIVLEQPETNMDFYRDVAILAFPAHDKNPEIIAAEIKSNGSQDEVKKALDKNEETFFDIKNITPENPLWFDFKFNGKQDVAAVTLKVTGGRLRDFIIAIEISTDGINYKKIKDFTSRSKGILGWNTKGKGSSLTLAFPVQNTEYIRVKFEKNLEFRLAEIKLFETERIDAWEIKAAQIQYTEHGAAADYYLPDQKKWEEAHPNAAIDEKEVLDLTTKLGADNLLDWTPTVGKWRILRIGYTTNGKMNSPSTVEGRGLEADKLNPVSLDKHYDGFMKKLNERHINKTTKSLMYSEIDSWEAGVQNWTDNFQEEFFKQHGYDLKPFLPALTGGYIVGSYEITERFLWDYRKTVATLIQNGCFSHLAQRFQRDSILVFAEGSGRQQYLYDPINYQSAADIPKGEFWVGPDMGANIPEDAPDGFMRPRIDCKVASSVAHIYGKQLAASESFTGGTLTFEQGPFDLKMLGDKAFCMGINWLVLHTSAHQPYDFYKPGFSLGMAGSHFHRNNIAHEKNFGWLDYVARCQYLLRQGNFVADVLCYIGDDVPNYLGFRNELSLPLPDGYDYDGCNSDILLNHTSVKNGKIVLDSGMEYRYLFLPDNAAMSPEALRKIESLLNQGATVIGRKPVRANGLGNFGQNDSIVSELANRIWGKCNGENITENTVGKGRVFWGKSFEEIASTDKLMPDFQYSSDAENTEINYIHRSIGETEIYFIANGNYRKENISAKFRVKGKTPVLFVPETGEVVATANYSIAKGFVEMPFELPEAGSVFVVFTPEKPKPSLVKWSGETPVSAAYTANNTIGIEIPEPGKYELKLSNGKKETVEAEFPSGFELDGDWQISFPGVQPDSGKVVQSALFAWNSSPDFHIRHFSGTAVYKKSFQINSGYIMDNLKLYLSLGDVQEVASVKINGSPCAKLWNAPFCAEITGLVKEGENQLEIEITNTLANRMIGDEFFPADLKYKGHLISEIPEWINGKVKRKSERATFSIGRFYSKNNKLIESGLLGPVEIMVTQQKEIKIR